MDRSIRPAGEMHQRFMETRKGTDGTGRAIYPDGRGFGGRRDVGREGGGNGGGGDDIAPARSWRWNPVLFTLKPTFDSSSKQSEWKRPERFIYQGARRRADSA